MRGIRERSEDPCGYPRAEVTLRFQALLLYGMFASVASATPPQQPMASTPQGPLGTVQGQVLQEPGDQPIRKASVKLRSDEQVSGEKYSAMTDEQGRFKIEEVKPGPYRVVVFHQGYFTGYQRERPSRIMVQAGEPSQELLFHLQRCAVITGTIVDSDGDPMRGVPVTAIMALSPRRKGTDLSWGAWLTNDLGEFRVPDLLPARYIISAVAPFRENQESTEGKGRKKERSVYTTTYYPSTLHREQAVPVEVHAGEEVQIRFELLATRAFRVSGSVTGLPVGSTGVKAMLTPKDSSQVDVDRESQEMKPDGNFEFKGVIPGVYTARAMAISNTAGGREPTAQFFKLTPAIEVREASVEGVRLQPEPVGQIHGKFRMDKGQKVDWTQLGAELIPTTGEQLQGVTDMTSSVPADLSGVDGLSWSNQDGVFEMRNVPAGTFLLGIATRSDARQEYFVKSVTLGGRDVADSGFFAGPDTNLEVVISPNVATIEGIVVNSHGEPVVRAAVEAAPSAEHRMHTEFLLAAMSDATGHFHLPGLHPGRYLLLAFEDPEDDLNDPEVMKKYEGKGDSVTVEEGAKKSVTLNIIAREGQPQ
jgi:hypothetical protein